MLMFLHWNFHCNGIILPCNKSVDSKVCFLVEEAEDYVPTNSPTPLPTTVGIIIKVDDINEVHEEEQSVELSLRITLFWNDSRLSATQQSKSSIDE